MWMVEFVWLEDQRIKRRAFFSTHVVKRYLKIISPSASTEVYSIFMYFIKVIVWNRFFSNTLWSNLKLPGDTPIPHYKCPHVPNKKMKMRNRTSLRKTITKEDEMSFCVVCHMIPEAFRLRPLCRHNNNRKWAHVHRCQEAQEINKQPSGTALCSRVRGEAHKSYS